MTAIENKSRRKNMIWMKNGRMANISEEMFAHSLNSQLNQGSYPLSSPKFNFCRKTISSLIFFIHHLMESLSFMRCVLYMFSFIVVYTINIYMTP
jgi:hypothetical protein